MATTWCKHFSELHFTSSHLYLSQEIEPVNAALLHNTCLDGYNGDR